MNRSVERPRTTCAQGGALTTIGSLPRVVALSHSAEGCGGNLTSSIATCAGYSGEGYCSGLSIPTSAIREKDIVFGGVERLEEEIRTAEELIDADLFVVVTGCMTEMIGDDVQSVVKKFENAETPIIAVSTPSFEGDAYAGYEIVLDGIFNRFLPPSDKKNPKLVNIFGVVPSFDPLYRGDLEELKRLLEQLGLQVNTFFTPDQSFDNIRSAPEAVLNIQLSHIWGIEFVSDFKEHHGTPFWVTDLPIGADATEKFLRALSKHIHIPGQRLEQVISRENERYYNYFTRTAELMMNSQFFFYAATVTNSNYAIPVVSFLKEELGWQIDDIFVTDLLTDNRKLQLEQAFADAGLSEQLFFEPNTKKIGRAITNRHQRDSGERYFDAHMPLYLIGSALEKYAAQDLGAQTLAISYPVYNRLVINRGYAGYNGGLRLFEDLISVLIAGK